MCHSGTCQLSCHIVVRNDIKLLNLEMTCQKVDKSIWGQLVKSSQSDKFSIWHGHMDSRLHGEVPPGSAPQKLP
jgi:hypothetical protein